MIRISKAIMQSHQMTSEEDKRQLDINLTNSLKFIRDVRG